MAGARGSAIAALVSLEEPAAVSLIEHGTNSTPTWYSHL
jgi:hypothetical protein